jgi:hypothetical protein
MVPEHKCGDAGSLTMLKRSHKVLSLSEKVNTVELIRKEKTHLCAEVTKVYGTKKPSFCERGGNSRGKAAEIPAELVGGTSWRQGSGGWEISPQVLQSNCSSALGQRPRGPGQVCVIPTPCDSVKRQ